jgi:hypothetical protein
VPTKRRKVGTVRLRRTDQVPHSVRWWLHHGRSIGVAEAHTLDMGIRDAWQVSLLHFDRSTAPNAAFWTRAHVREAGYGAVIDAHVAAGKCPADGWRKPPSAEVIDLARHAAKPQRSR